MIRTHTSGNEVIEAVLADALQVTALVSTDHQDYQKSFNHLN